MKWQVATEPTQQEILTAVDKIRVDSGAMVDKDGSQYRPIMRKRYTVDGYDIPQELNEGGSAVTSHIIDKYTVFIFQWSKLYFYNNETDKFVKVIDLTLTAGASYRTFVEPTNLASTMLIANGYFFIWVKDSSNQNAVMKVMAFDINDDFRMTTNSPFLNYTSMYVPTVRKYKDKFIISLRNHNATAYMVPISYFTNRGTTSFTFVAPADVLFTAPLYAGNPQMVGYFEPKEDEDKLYVIVHSNNQGIFDGELWIFNLITKTFETRVDFSHTTNAQFLRGANGYLRWMPDGRLIYFTGSYGIRIIDPVTLVYESFFPTNKGSIQEIMYEPIGLAENRAVSIGVGADNYHIYQFILDARTQTLSYEDRYLITNGRYTLAASTTQNNNQNVIWKNTIKVWDSQVRAFHTIRPCYDIIGYEEVVSDVVIP